MNQYKIKTKNGAYAHTVIELNEKDAIKELKARFKENGATLKDNDIESVELVVENVSATKEQERKAVEQIKAILATLGESSYLATAMDGVLEDAESNIENDFADSYKSRYEHAESRYNALRLKAELAEDKVRETQATIEQQAKEIEALKQSIPQDDDITDAIECLRGRAQEYEDDATKQARAIVENADKPESIEFQNAVRNHRNAQKSLEYVNAVIDRLHETRVGA